jgi:transposase InsO family protein
MFGKCRAFNAERNIALKDMYNVPLETSTLLMLYEKSRKENIRLNVMINETACSGLLDTGASTSIIGNGSKYLIRNLKSIDNGQQGVRTANGQLVKCLGKLQVAVTYDGITRRIKMLVVPEIVEQVILGMNFFHTFNLSVVNDRAEKVNLISEKPKQQESLDLTVVQQEQLHDALKGFKFSSEDFVGCQTVIKHHIETGEQKPICQRLYQYSPDMENKIKEEIDRWLKLGYIEAANTEWRHPIVPVIKKNGKVRLCLDARKLNQITKRDAYVSPDLNHIFRRFPQAKLFFSVDLTDAFMQTELTEESKEKTAFGIPGKGCYQYKRMPFGLLNSSKTQSRVMNLVIGEDLEPKVFHYLDDIVVAADDFDELVQLIKKVAERLSRYGLTVNPDKLNGPCERIKFVGRVFDCNGQHPEEAKVEAIKNLSIPKTVKEVRSIVGMMNWYAHFIRDFSTVIAPITALIKRKAQKVLWNDDANDAFKKVKEILASYPVLRSPDYKRPFIVQSDASQVGIGGVLAQMDDNNQEYVIGYFSHKLTKEEQKYHTYERECLAVLKTLDHFKPYIYLQPLIIITDHHSLTQTLKYNGKSGRLLRWSLLLQQHAHQIIHRPGSQMMVADALSRAQIQKVQVDDDEFKYYSIQMVQEEITEVVYPLNEQQFARADNQTKAFEILRRKVMERPDGNLNYIIRDLRLYKKIATGSRDIEDWKEVPHPTQRERAYDWAHDKVLHGGNEKTIDKLKEKYWWKGMKHDVSKWNKMCVHCAQIKAPNYSCKGILPEFHLPERVGVEIQVDFKGPLPETRRNKFKHIIVVQEALSRYLIAECIQNANVVSAIKFLETKVLPIFPNIKVIRHDRASQFLSENFKTFLRRKGIKAIPTASYAPHQNPVERANRAIGEALTLFMLRHPENHQGWHQYVDTIIERINERKHNATALKPKLVVTGRNNDGDEYDATRHADIMRLAYENSKKTYEARRQQHNKQATTRCFDIGNIIMAKYRTLSSGGHHWMAKLAAKYYPVKIIRKCGHNTYEVMDIHKQTHIIDVRSMNNVVPELEEVLKEDFEEILN